MDPQAMSAAEVTEAQIAWVLEQYRTGAMSAAEVTEALAATAANNLGQTRPGWLTSQFWIAVGGAVLGALAMVGELASGNHTAQVIGAVGAVGLPALYQITRSSLQKVQVQAAAVTPAAAVKRVP